MKFDEAYQKVEMEHIHILQDTIDQAQRSVLSNSMAESLQILANAGALVDREALMKSAKVLEEVAARQLSNMEYSGIRFELPQEVILRLFESQIHSIAQIQMSGMTEMIRSFQNCLTAFDVQGCIHTLSDAMNKPLIDVTDMTFIRTNEFAGRISDYVQYPRGIRSTISKMSQIAIQRLSVCEGMSYRTKSKQFIIERNPEATSSLKEINVICSGAHALESLSDGEELFSETELVEFMNLLNNEEAFASSSRTGQKIETVIREYGMGIDFDRNIYYHARARKKGEAPFLDAQMLVAPYGVTEAGRYNRPGRAYYYFSDTSNGAINEATKHKKDDEVVQVAQIRPVCSVRMLDLSGGMKGCKHFLESIRYSASDANSKMPREYLIPNYVSDCCRHLNYDGVKYYGSKEYNNYVSWRDRCFETV